MEDLIKNDSTFELYHNSEGADTLNNRVLLSYPSEKSSFDVFLGFEGHSNFEETEAEKKARLEAEAKANKPKIDSEKLAQGITAGATALGSVVGTVQAFKGDGTKAPSRRKSLKDACGRKPLFGKEKKGYNDCVKEYNAGKIGGVNTKAPESSSNETPPETPPETNNTTRNIIIGVVVLALGVTAFIGYKKGWFGKKAG